MQKKVYMTVDGNRRETTSLVLKASDNTQKTASLEADVTLDLETKALGTVNLGQSYTVNPSTGKDGMIQVTFNVPAAPSGGNTPTYQSKNLGSVNAGQHYDVSADSGYDALALVSFDVPAAQGGSSNPFAGVTNPNTAEMMPVAYAFKKMLETNAKGTFQTASDNPEKIQLFDTGLDVVHGIVICSTANGHYTTAEQLSSDISLAIIDNDSHYFTTAYNAPNRSASGAIHADGYYELVNGNIYVEESAVYIQNKYNGIKWAPFPSGHTYMWFAW